MILTTPPADPYAVEYVQLKQIKPSPENDDIYGPVTHDAQMRLLIDSIQSRNLEEPLIVSADGFIISGHRRYFALKWIHGSRHRVPVRRKSYARADHLDEWPRILAEYNPQRIKSVGSLLKESLLRHADDNPRALLKQREQAAQRGTAEFNEVLGTKTVRRITAKKQQFLDAITGVVEELKEFWPLTVRQIHYNLLNNPPLITTPQRSKFDIEKYRYKNDATSYDALVSILTPARYEGYIPMTCIDDPTRPRFVYKGYTSLSEFVDSEMEHFLCGYHYDKQLDQPRHIEVLGEKNTLTQIVKPVCEEYYIPLSLGRGYSSVPVFREIADRFRSSGKPRMTLVVCSDYDPEGLDLADDALRTLRDLWDLPVDLQRVGITREQVDELGLADDHNPAKVTSSRFRSFSERTGGTQTWELEALPPHYLRERVRDALQQNMDMEVFNAAVDRENSDAVQLQRLRREIVDSFNL